MKEKEANTLREDLRKKQSTACTQFEKHERKRRHEITKEYYILSDEFAETARWTRMTKKEKDTEARSLEAEEQEQHDWIGRCEESNRENMGFDISADRKQLPALWTVVQSKRKRSTSRPTDLNCNIWQRQYA